MIKLSVLWHSAVAVALFLKQTASEKNYEDDLAAVSTKGSNCNFRPVIGIYSAPLYETTASCNVSGKCDYVAASYVKWLEHAGAEAVPIRYNSTDEEIEAIFGQVNGVLFPGGGSETPTGARRVVELALKSNDEGDFFPIWGTCLGFEWLVQILSGDDEILQSGFDAENISLPLNLTNDAQDSRLLGPISSSYSAGHR